jgi:hypothetical protein
MNILIDNSIQEKYLITEKITTEKKEVLLEIKLNLNKINTKNEINFFNKLDQIIAQINELIELKKMSLIKSKIDFNENELITFIQISYPNQINNEKINKKITNELKNIKFCHV